MDHKEIYLVFIPNLMCQQLIFERERQLDSRSAKLLLVCRFPLLPLNILAEL
jgi:hypothetical protein